MESESEEFEVNQVTSSFFSGLSRTPKLSQKQTMLRQNIHQNSQMASKSTTLQEKITNMSAQPQRKRLNNQDFSQLNPDNGIFKQTLLVQENQAPRKKNSSQFTMTLQPGQKGKTFEDLKLSRVLLRAINDLQYSRPTPIQILAVPVISSGKDVLASSITGSGKTAAFLLPIIQRYHNVAAVGYIRALIVTPTRELAIQIYEQFEKLNKYGGLQGALAIGASSIQRQELALRNNPEVVIGTPGRIIDLLINSRSVGIQNLEMLIFDEADKLLQLGFQSEIKEIMRHCNRDVQTVMFSATMGKDIDRLALIATRKPIRLSADPDNKTAEKLHQQIVKLKEDTEEYREAVLLSVLTYLYKKRVIVFFKTKKQCHRMAIILGLLGLKACELHGNLSQTQRINAFMDFKDDKYDFLLATDLASRGLDIKQVQTVINFELPTHITKYIHRIGRTARAGSVGTSLTLCSDSEGLELKRMSRKTGDKLFRLNIDEGSVRKYSQSIHGLGRQIATIMGQERQQMDIRRAQMELKKLENIQDHRTDIYSRPKKEWFMTGKEKRDTQEKAKVETGEVLPEQKSKKIFKRRGNAPQKGRNPQRPPNKGRPSNPKKGGFPKKKGNFPQKNRR